MRFRTAGRGEATLEWKTRSVTAAIGDLAPLVIGRDPRDIEKIVRIMKKHIFWRLGAIGMSAISGIEIALWDIYGKSLYPGVEAAGRASARKSPSLHASRPWRHASGLRDRIGSTTDRARATSSGAAIGQ
jgi:hypothetical protein